MRCLFAQLLAENHQVAEVEMLFDLKSKLLFNQILKYVTIFLSSRVPHLRRFPPISCAFSLPGLRTDAQAMFACRQRHLD